MEKRPTSSGSLKWKLIQNITNFICVLDDIANLDDECPVL